MIHPLGKVVVPAAGTPLSLQTVLTAQNIRFKSFHAIHLQALYTNTGRVYIGQTALDKATLANCIHVLSIPTANFIPSFGIALMPSPAGVDASILFFDVDNAGEGMLISLLEA